MPTLLYNLAVLPVVRGARVPGRGGVTYSHFDYAEMREDPPHPCGPVRADDAWERISYFVDRVIPVAEEVARLSATSTIRGFPPGVGYRGIERVLGLPRRREAFRRSSPQPVPRPELSPGEFIAEMCTHPEQVYDAIRYSGEQKRIFWVHFRNIRGGLKFDEVFPDEGDVDMCRAIRTYHEVGYDGVLEPDHVPTPIWTRRTAIARGRSPGLHSRLIQMVESEAPRA